MYTVFSRHQRIWTFPRTHSAEFVLITDLMSRADLTSYRAQKASKCIRGRRRRRAHRSALPFLLKDGFDLHRAEDLAVATARLVGSISDQSRSRNGDCACSSAMILQQFAARSRCQRARHDQHVGRTRICTNVHCIWLPRYTASQRCPTRSFCVQKRLRGERDQAGWLAH